MTATSDRGGLRAAALTRGQTAAVAYVRSLAVVERPSALAAIARQLTTADVGHRAGASARGHPVRAADRQLPPRPVVCRRPDRRRRPGRGRAVPQPVRHRDLQRWAHRVPRWCRDRWEQPDVRRRVPAARVTPAHRPTYGGLNLLDHADGPAPLRLLPPAAAPGGAEPGDLLPRRQPPQPGDGGHCRRVRGGARRAPGRRRRHRRCSAAPGRTPRRWPGRAGPADHPGRGRSLARRLRGGPGPRHARPRVRRRGVGGRPVLRRHPDRRDAGIDRRAVRFPCGGGTPASCWPSTRSTRSSGGPRSPASAARVHREFARSGDPVDAALIGRAAASVVVEPHRWADRGPITDTLQHLKQLWHVLVRFGAPYTAPDLPARHGRVDRPFSVDVPPVGIRHPISPGDRDRTSPRPRHFRNARQVNLVVSPVPPEPKPISAVISRGVFTPERSARSKGQPS